MGDIYKVEYTFKNLMVENSKPERQPSFRVGAESLDDAGRVAGPTLIKTGFSAGMYDI